jgi:pantoate--beta-alanine ligase
MKIWREVSALRAEVAGWKRQGLTVGVVPTMGALHPGHLALVDAARASCDRVVVTIFVNPKQFNNSDDLAKYPRTEARDAELLAPYRVDGIFAPAPEEVYPAGFASSVSVSGLTETLEGSFRPGHFDGMATVVAKLFGMTQADRAYFGEKDWQQLQVVRRMVADLNIAVEVIGCPTLRETDGLAMSSRNSRLTPAERAIAPALFAAMTAAAAALHGGAPVAETLAAAKASILAAGYTGVDYLELRGAADLAPQTELHAPARLLAAAELGAVRLIDNIAV